MSDEGAFPRFIAGTHHRGATANGEGARPEEEVNKEKAAHGVSVVEVRKNSSGDWELVLDSQYNRRITGSMEMELTGIVAGTDLVKTAAGVVVSHG